MASPLAHAVHTIYVQLNSVTKQLQDLDKKVKEIDTNMQQQVAHHPTDPVVLKRLNDIDDKNTQLRDSIRNLTEDFRTFKVQIKDTSAIETSVQTRLEQYVTKLVKERCSIISDETKMMINSLKNSTELSADDDEH
jgi:flagellar capping protein FliD